MTSPSTYKLGYPKLLYGVVPMASGAPFQRDPTTSDLFDPRVGGYYKIGTIWPNEATGGVWILGSISNGTTANWLGITDAASGNVDGPASATDNALARFDGTTGKLIQNSVGVLTDAGSLTGLTSVGIGIAPTAYLGLKAGTATAGTAPLKFALGVNLGTPEAGAVEYDGAHLTYTNNSAARQTLAVGPASSTDNRLTRMDGTAGAIQQATGTLLSDTDVMTFPSGGGNVLTAGAGAAERKGTFTFDGSGTHTKILTTAAVTGCVLVYTVVTLGTVTAAQAILTTIDTGVGFTPVSAANNDSSVVNWAIVG